MYCLLIVCNIHDAHIHTYRSREQMISAFHPYQNMMIWDAYITDFLFSTDVILLNLRMHIDVVSSEQIKDLYTGTNCSSYRLDMQRRCREKE